MSYINSQCYHVVNKIKYKDYKQNEKFKKHKIELENRKLHILL